MRLDWLLSGVLVVATVVAFGLWARLFSARLADHWFRFHARPIWHRYLVYTGLIWVGLRLLRGGIRLFLGYVLVVGCLFVWAAASAHTKRS